MTVDEIQRVLQQEPRLTLCGLGLTRQRGRAPGQTLRTAAFRAERAALGAAVAQCTCAAAWLAAAPRQQRLNRRAGSAGLTALCAALAGRYIANGALICAAIHLGFRYDNGPRRAPSVHAWFNIAQRWVQEQARLLRQLRGGSG
jgi:hypothetical protein